MTDMFKSLRLGDILPCQSIGIFDTTFLPRRVWVCKVHFDTKTPANHLMTCELCSIVRCNRPDMFLKWSEQVYYSTRQFLCILTLRQLSHKQHIGTTLNQRDNCPMVAFADYSVHLEVTETFAIRFFRAFADTCSVWYRYTFSTDWSGTMLQSVSAMFIQVATFRLVFAYKTIDGLMRYMLAFHSQSPRDLLW